MSLCVKRAGRAPAQDSSAFVEALLKMPQNLFGTRFRDIGLPYYPLSAKRGICYLVRNDFLFIWNYFCREIKILVKPDSSCSNRDQRYHTTGEYMYVVEFGVSSLQKCTVCLLKIIEVMWWHFGLRTPPRPKGSPPQEPSFSHYHPNLAVACGRMQHHVMAPCRGHYQMPDAPV